MWSCWRAGRHLQRPEAQADSLRTGSGWNTPEGPVGWEGQGVEGEGWHWGGANSVGSPVRHWAPLTTAGGWPTAAGLSAGSGVTVIWWREEPDMTHIT